MATVIYGPIGWIKTCNKQRISALYKLPVFEYEGKIDVAIMRSNSYVILTEEPLEELLAVHSAKKHMYVPYSAVLKELEAEAKPAKDPEVFIQPKITGYRQLSEEEVALMNEGNALAEQVGEYIAKLRNHPATAADGIPRIHEAYNSQQKYLHSLDQRWISIGATQLQQGFMAVIRGIAQPSTF